MSIENTILLKKFGELEIRKLRDNRLVITDQWLTDYPVNYGYNDNGEFLGTAYDGLFFYHQDWLNNQDDILNFVTDYHKAI